jgi:hypothetical protein
LCFHIAFLSLLATVFVNILTFLIGDACKVTPLGLGARPKVNPVTAWLMMIAIFPVV